jgi:hypothetical protein
VLGGMSVTYDRLEIDGLEIHEINDKHEIVEMVLVKLTDCR